MVSPVRIFDKSPDEQCRAKVSQDTGL